MARSRAPHRPRAVRRRHSPSWPGGTHGRRGSRCRPVPARRSAATAPCTRSSPVRGRRARPARHARRAGPGPGAAPAWPPARPARAARRGPAAERSHAATASPPARPTRGRTRGGRAGWRAVPARRSTAPASCFSRRAGGSAPSGSGGTAPDPRRRARCWATGRAAIAARRRSRRRCCAAVRSCRAARGPGPATTACDRCRPR